MRDFIDTTIKNTLLRLSLSLGLILVERCTISGESFKHNGDIFKYKIVGNVDKENADFYLELINKLIYNNRDTINKKKLEDLLEKLKVFGVEMEVFLHDNI